MNSKKGQKLTLATGTHMSTSSKSLSSTEEVEMLATINSIVNSPENINLSFREKIEKMEEVMLPMEQVEIPTHHKFSNGMYIRKIFIPAGTLLTSKYHKTGQFDVMLTGRMSIVTNEGIMEISAPYFGESSPGIKRFGYAHEDVLWMDIRIAEEDDIDKVEKLLFCDTYKELLEYQKENNFLLEEV